MKKWLIVAMCTTLVVAAPKYAMGFGDGNWLLESAVSDDPAVTYGYLNYVLGVSDGYQLTFIASDSSTIFCVGEPYGITNGDMGDAVRLWLRKNPEHLKVHASVVVVAALVAHFPCETD